MSPKLPRYDAQRTLTTEGPALQADPGKMGMAYGALAKTGEAVTDISQKWEKAQDVIQYTTAKNNLATEKSKILAEAELDTDYNGYEKYKKRIEELGTQDDKLSNRMAKDMFSLEKQNDLAETDILLQNTFKKKQVSHQKAEIVRSEAINKDAYINTVDPLQREKALQGHIATLDASFKAGLMTEEAYAKNLEEVKKWDYDRAMQDLGKDVNMVLDNLDGYDIDEKQKREVVAAAKTQANLNRSIDEVKQAETQYTNEKELDKYVLDDAADTVGAKLVKIGDAELRKQVSSTWASSARRYVNSVKRVDAKTNNETLNGIVRMMYDANTVIGEKGTEDASTSKEYLRRIGQIRSEILDRRADGKLSAEDELKLNKKLESLSQEKFSRATEGITQGGAPWARNNYKIADEYFRENVPEYLRETALREYFYETLDKEPTSAERTAILQKIHKEIVRSENPSTATLEDIPNGIGGMNGVSGVYPGTTTLPVQSKAKPKEPSKQYKVGDPIVVANKKYKITGFDTDGTPLVDEVDYGLRADGTKKGKGFLGELKRPDGKISTELSIGVNIGGQETEIPLLVPTLDKKEIASLLNDEKPSEKIVAKAVAHAKKRISEGKSPFAD